MAETEQSVVSSLLIEKAKLLPLLRVKWAAADDRSVPVPSPNEHRVVYARDKRVWAYPDFVDT